MADLAALARSLGGEEDLSALAASLGGVEDGVQSDFPLSEQELAQPNQSLQESPAVAFIRESMGNLAGDRAARIDAQDPEILRALFSGVVSAPAELAALPLQASEGVYEAITGQNIDGFGDQASRNIEAAKGAIAGDLGPEGRIAQAVGSFAGAGGAFRQVAKSIGDNLTLLNRLPITTDVAAGALSQSAAEAGQGADVQFAASIIPAILTAKVPKSDSLPKNAIEKEISGTLRAIKGSIGLAERNLAEEADIGVSTNLAALSENPNLSASVIALRQNDAINSKFVNIDRRFIRGVEMIKKEFDLGNDIANAAERFSAIKAAFQTVVDENIALQKELASSGTLNVAEAAEVFATNLSNMELAASGAASRLYTKANIDTLGKADSSKIISAVKDATKISVVKKSKQDVLGPELRRIERLIFNETGGKTIKAKTIEQPNGKTIVLKKERLIDGDNPMSASAMKEIRTEAMDAQRSIRAAAGGETDDTRRLGKIISSLTESLDQFPALSKANYAWRTMNEMFHDGQLATFFAKRGSGIEKTAPEQIMSMFINGTQKKRNAEQALRIISHYDKDGSLKSKFMADLEGAFNASLRAEMGLKDELSASKWGTWLKKNAVALDAYGLKGVYSKFGVAAEKAKNAASSLSEIERTGFAQIAQGRIDETVNNALMNNTLGNLQKTMPDDFMRKAVTKRAAANIIDFQANLGSPQKLLKIVADNKSSLVDTLGEEGFKRLSGIVNAIRRTGLEKGVAPNVARTRIISEETVQRSVLNKITAVIGSRFRRGIKIGQAIQDGSASRRIVEAYAHAMVDEKSFKRLIRLSKTDPDTFRDAWLMSFTAPLAETQ